ncbi:hypothetical protein [Neorhizobium sp. NCHU2750]|uniref:hypothetical protein n=1 Tax=Neorhizobium sp. NCHU2750 TaxID=1825976 RepID=UPI000E75881B|nr:hypothetical protein NCHU2750_52840 [Neorhizobium sp. NCHU2750]
MTIRRVSSILGMLLAVSLGTTAHAELKGISSREYKLGLDPKSLSGPTGDVFKTISERLQTALPLQFGAASHGKVQFFDTQACDLSHGSMLLRYRQRDGKAERVTLKIRDADILAIDTSPLRPAQGKMPKIEDDFSIRETGKAASDFSKSFSYEGGQPATVGELAEHLLHLDKVSKAAASDRFVGGPPVSETVYASKPVRLTDSLDVTVEVSLWYGEGSGKPLAGDVSFTIDGPFEHQSLAVAGATLERLATSLGDMRGSSGEKSLAVVPEQCR